MDGEQEQIKERKGKGNNRILSDIARHLRCAAIYNIPATATGFSEIDTIGDPESFTWVSTLHRIV